MLLPKSTVLVGCWFLCGVLWYSVFIMEKKSIVYGILVGVLLVIVVGFLWVLDRQEAPKREAYADLVQCLSEEDVIFYGAFWCPACAQQKAMFGGSAKKLPYEECSLPNRSQNEMCTEKEITNYPVWEFVREDDTLYRCGGIVSPEVLAHLAGCPLPSYDGVDNTVDGLYERLVVETLTESLKKRGVPSSTIQETIDSAVEGINQYLTDTYGTTVDDTDSVAYLLTAISETLHSCAPFEQQVEEGVLEVGDIADIELVPAEDVGSEGDGE